MLEEINLEIDNIKPKLQEKYGKEFVEEIGRLTIKVEKIKAKKLEKENTVEYSEEQGMN